MTPERVDAYLERIAYRGPRQPTLAVLEELHRGHLFAVPFENLDIHLGRPIALDQDALFEKIVVHRRGGFCYELNGLFAALLGAFGYRVTLLSARVWGGEGFSPEFDHLALRVDLEHAFLVDVGFGDSFVLPPRFDDGGERVEGGHAYRVRADGDRRVLEVRDPSGAWQPSYSLSLEPRALEAFTDRCAYHQTSPDSHFKRGRICSLATPTGRISLSDTRLLTTIDGVRSERAVNAGDGVDAALAEHFGVHIG